MLQKNVTYSLGGLALIELAEKYFSVFSEIFGNIHAESMDFQKIGELLVYNRLTHSVSIHQIMNTYPTEVFRDLGFKHIPSERSIYRALEKVGRLFPVLLERYQLFLKKYDLADDKQFIDFSSSYFEGTKSELGAYGYSKDKRADKMQVEFGISTGLNEIPTALTIQKGNMNDKKHMNEILNIVPRVIPKNSMLIFDTGGNTKKNKNKIRAMGYHYLTLKPKKISPYKKELSYFKKQYDAKNVEIIKIDDNIYYCA
ncbi:MAG: transposase, partial [Thermoplasmata archaeon]